jgi:hypothetical protein
MNFENYFITSILNTELSDIERLELDSFMKKKLIEFNLVPMIPRNNSSTFFSEGVHGFDIVDIEDILKKYVKAYIKNFLKNNLKIDVDVSQIEGEFKSKCIIKHESNQNHFLHTHGSNIFCIGVYVHKLPKNSGNTWLRNPDNAMIHVLPISEFVELDLHEGHILVFPSWLTHMVSNNLSVEDRIVLHFGFDWNFGSIDKDFSTYMNHFKNLVNFK